MQIFPKDPEIDPNEGFEENDIFGYKEFAEGITSLLEKSDDPIVAILDSPWGNGKTTFIKMWAGYLRKHEFPVIEFDAFQHDYNDDPFESIAGEITELIYEKKKASTSKSKKVMNKAASIMGATTKAAMKVGVGQIVGAAVEEMLKNEEDKIEDDMKRIVSASEKFTSDLLLDRLKSHKKKKNLFNEFKHALTELPSVLGIENKPLIFIIDELDRCRPDFALTLLEKIRHFFSVPNVHFILSTHIEILAASVTHRYGKEIDGALYLHKFYNLHLELPNHISDHQNSSSHQTAKARKYCHFLSNQFSPELSEHDMLPFLVQVALANNLSLRELAKIASYCKIACIIKKNKRLIFEPFLIAGLAYLKVTQPEILLRLRDRKSNQQEIEAAFRFHEFPEKNILRDVHISKYHFRWLAHVINENDWKSSKFDQHRSLFARVRRLDEYLDREDLIPFFIETYFSGVSI